MNQRLALGIRNSGLATEPRKAIPAIRFPLKLTPSSSTMPVGSRRAGAASDRTGVASRAQQTSALGVRGTTAA